jgi:hypothetical protein
MHVSLPPVNMTPFSDLIIKITPILLDKEASAFGHDAFRRSLHSFLSRSENDPFFRNEVYCLFS